MPHCLKSQREEKNSIRDFYSEAIFLCHHKNSYQTNETKRQVPLTAVTQNKPAPLIGSTGRKLCIKSRNHLHKAWEYIIGSSLTQQPSGLTFKFFEFIN